LFFTRMCIYGLIRGRRQRPTPAASSRWFLEESDQEGESKKDERNKGGGSSSSAEVGRNSKLLSTAVGCLKDGTSELVGGVSDHPLFNGPDKTLLTVGDDVSTSTIGILFTILGGNIRRGSRGRRVGTLDRLGLTLVLERSSQVSELESHVQIIQGAIAPFGFTFTVGVVSEVNALACIVLHVATDVLLVTCGVEKSDVASVYVLEHVIIRVALTIRKNVKRARHGVGDEHLCKGASTQNSENKQNLHHFVQKKKNHSQKKILKIKR